MRAENVSGLFLCWANNEGKEITNLKMQKLLYYAQAWHLAKFEKPLFKNEVEAWEFGPVIKDVYCSYEDCCFKPIKYCQTNTEEKAFGKEQLSFLRQVYDTFMPFSPSELLEMTQTEDPWLKTYQPEKKEIISKKLMESYYREMLKSTGRL